MSANSMNHVSMGRTARIALKTLVAACASLALVTGAQAQHGGGHGFGGGHVAGGYGHGHYGGGGHGYYRGGGRGWGWGGVGLGLGLGLGFGAAYYGSPYYGAYGYPAPYVVESSPVMTDGYIDNGGQPLIYPRHGQNPAQTDADGNACSQWAGQQPNATTNGSIFQRGFAACMDGRGYTIR